MQDRESSLASLPAFSFCCASMYYIVFDAFSRYPTTPASLKTTHYTLQDVGDSTFDSSWVLQAPGTLPKQTYLPSIAFWDIFQMSWSTRNNAGGHPWEPWQVNREILYYPGWFYDVTVQRKNITVLLDFFKNRWYTACFRQNSFRMAESVRIKCALGLSVCFCGICSRPCKRLLPTSYLSSSRSREQECFFPRPQRWECGWAFIISKLVSDLMDCNAFKVEIMFLRFFWETLSRFLSWNILAFERLWDVKRCLADPSVCNLKFHQRRNHYELLHLKIRIRFKRRWPLFKAVMMPTEYVIGS